MNSHTVTVKVEYRDLAALRAAVEHFGRNLARQRNARPVRRPVGDREDRERSRIAGCDAYMTKPLRYHELYAVIDSLLNKGKSRTDLDVVGAIP